MPVLDYDEALKIVLERAPQPRRTERVELTQSAGRVLAEDAVADVDMPPFDKSAMDGFAVRAADLADVPVELEVVMDVPAGSVPTGVIGRGQAAAIMTGAPVPKGADTVIQVEWTSGFGASRVKINRAAKPGNHISSRGEILKNGAQVLTAGTPIGPEEISLLATVGRDPVAVYEPPTVAVLSTGDELVDPGTVPGPGQIRNSNGPCLVGWLKSLGLGAIDLGRVSDDREATLAAVKRGLECDCLLISGGVSVGAYDFVEEGLAALGVSVHTQKVAIKPGKPTVFGTLGDKMDFGLPGNPVSTMVIAKVLVEPALKKRLGYRSVGPWVVRAKLRRELKKKPDRLWFVHGVLKPGLEWGVSPLKGRGSADLPNACQGNCLIVGPKGESVLASGTEVDVVVWDRAITHPLAG